jgi:hypothetical protein
MSSVKAVAPKRPVSSICVISTSVALFPKQIGVRVFIIVSESLICRSFTVMTGTFLYFENFSSGFEAILTGTIEYGIFEKFKKARTQQQYGEAWNS